MQERQFDRPILGEQGGGVLAARDGGDRNSSKSVLASVMFRFPQIARQAGSHAIHSL